MIRTKKRKDSKNIDGSKLKDILKYAKIGDVIIRDGHDEVVILLNTKNKKYELTKEGIKKLTKELNKKKIGYEFCECQGCGACFF